MKTIPLSQGMVAFVDNNDYGQVKSYKWYAVNVGTKQAPRYYAQTTIWENNTNIKIYLHRFIIGDAAQKMDVAFKDGNSLNVQKDNLLVINHEIHGAKTNRQRTGRVNKTGFVGVTFHKQTNTYRAKIIINGKRISLGYFPTPEEAAQAYSEKLKEIKKAQA